MKRKLTKYPAYEDSGLEWLGKVPKDWNLSPGFSVLRETHTRNVGLIETTVLSLSYGKIVVKPIEKLHGLVPASFETYQIVDPGDIIIRPTDLQNDWTSLRVGIVRDRGIITSAYLCLRVLPPLTAEYGYLLLHSYDLMKIFYGMGSGLRQNLDFKDLKRMPLLIPTAGEQQQIVRYSAFASKRVDRLIQAKQKLIKLLNEQKHAIIQRVVTRGLDPNVRLKPSDSNWLGDLPACWNVVRLKYLATVQTGITLGKSYGQTKLETRPYLRVANVQDGYLDLTHIKTIEVPSSEAESCELRLGDVLMTEGGDIDKLGRGYVWRDEIKGCLHQNHVFAVRADSQRLVPEFLALLMTSRLGRHYFQKTAKRTTNLASTNSTKIKSFPLVLPDVKEQRDLLAYVKKETSSYDAAIDRARFEITLLREYRTRLIADVVTGKLDVRDVTLPEIEETEEIEMIKSDDNVNPEDSGNSSALDETEELAYADD